MSKIMINFPYVIGQYEEVTDHVFTMAAMRTGKGKKKKKSDMDNLHHRVIKTDYLEGLWNFFH